MTRQDTGGAWAAGRDESLTPEKAQDIILENLERISVMAEHVRREGRLGEQTIVILDSRDTDARNIIVSIENTLAIQLMGDPWVVWPLPTSFIRELDESREGVPEEGRRRLFGPREQGTVRVAVISEGRMVGAVLNESAIPPPPIPTKQEAVAKLSFLLSSFTPGGFFGRGKVGGAS